MGKPAVFRKVITAIQKFKMDGARLKGAIPLINAGALKRGMVSKPEKKFMLSENIFDREEVNP